MGSLYVTKEELWELIDALKKIEQKNKQGYTTIVVQFHHG